MLPRSRYRPIRSDLRSSNMTDSQLPTNPPAPSDPPASAPVTEPDASSSSYSIVPETAKASEPRGNGLGLAALIVGILAFFGAFVPFLNYATGFVAFVGIVLGVIALVLKGRKKAVAAIGTGVSVVALILSIVLAIVYTAGFVSAVDDAGVNIDDSGVTAPGDTEEEPATEAPAEEEQGTRANPYPAGTTLSFTEAGAPFYDVTVGAATLNANDIIAAANMFNEAPPAGTQFALLPLTVTYTGAETGTPWVDLTVEFVAADGTSHTQSDVFVVGPAELIELNELYPGASGTGNVVINVPSADVEQGTWLLRVGFISGEDVFFAAQ
jgi:hypothetical protein